MVIVNLAARNSTLIDNSRIARAIVTRSQQRLLRTRKKQNNKTKQNTQKKNQTNKKTKRKKNKRRSDPSAETLTFKEYLWPLTSTGTNETGQYHIEAKMAP